MNQFIILSRFELQCGSTRVKNAEDLILQLPKTHDGRNTWLLNYGVGEEALQLRKKYPKLKWSKLTTSLETINK